jgi:adenine-specific DNA-methyltransferase
MPILNWIGKDAVVNHDKDVPFRLLKKNKSKSVGDSENLIIEGDNLEALKALLPHYQNKIKCIYIDPPYNTGNEKWKYNDNVNSPKIKKWLGKVVGKQEEDLSRHDKWLCMMYPRLKLLRELLSDDGVIFVSIDDDEHTNLDIIIKEIFGEENFIANIVWQKVYSPKNQSKRISVDHEYVISYAKNIDTADFNLLPRTEKMNKAYKNPDNDPRGNWKPGDLIANEERTEGHYEIKSPSGKIFNSPPGKHWGVSEKIMHEMIKDNRVWFGKKGDAIPSSKQFLNEVQQGRKASTLFLYQEAGHTDEAKKELLTFFNQSDELFPTTKPTRLIKQILRLSTTKNDIILDSFAGSGTTGQAVLELNKEDGGNRKFILVELEPEICKNITAQRVKQVIEGYSYKNTNSVTLYQKKISIKDLKNMNIIFQEIDDIKRSEEKNFEKIDLTFNNRTITLFGENTSSEKRRGVGGGFQYAVLDKKLFNSDGRINEDCTFDELATYIYFIETKTILDKKKVDKTLIGTYNDTEYHLIFKGIGKNNLDRKFLVSLDRQKNKVIYADKCALDDSFIEKHNTIFKQIPYEVKEF